MPDCPESTLTVPEAQQQLAALVEDLRRLDQRLSVVAADIAQAAERRPAVADAVERLAAAA